MSKWRIKDENFNSTSYPTFDYLHDAVKYLVSDPNIWGHGFCCYIVRAPVARYCYYFFSGPYGLSLQRSCNHLKSSSDDLPF